MLFADQANHAVGHLERCAGHLQQRADERAEDDYDTDARKRAGKALPDDARDVLQRDAAQYRQQQRYRENGEKRVNLELGNCQNHQHNADNKGNHQGNASHISFPPIHDNSADVRIDEIP